MRNTMTKLNAITSVTDIILYMHGSYTINAELGITYLICKFTVHEDQLANCSLTILHSSIRKDSVHRLAGFSLVQSLLRSTIFGQLRRVPIFKIILPSAKMSLEAVCGAVPSTISGAM